MLVKDYEFFGRFTSVVNFRLLALNMYSNKDQCLDLSMIMQLFSIRDCNVNISRLCKVCGRLISVLKMKEMFTVVDMLVNF